MSYIWIVALATLTVAGLEIAFAFSLLPSLIVASACVASLSLVAIVTCPDTSRRQ